MSTPEDLLGFAPESEFTSSASDNDRHPVIRGDRFNVEHWLDHKKLITFMNSMRHVPLDGIDDEIVNDSYSAVVWLFRKAVVEGDLKAASTAEKWLLWAKPIIGKAKPAEAPTPSKGSIAFLAREPKANEE